MQRLVTILGLLAAARLAAAAEPAEAPQPDAPVLRKILADWAERQARFGRVEVVLKGTEHRPKGSLNSNAGWLNPVPSGDFPAEDHHSPCRYRIVLDLPGGRARIERDREIPGPDLVFHRTYAVLLADRDRFQTLHPRDRNPGSRIPELVESESPGELFAEPHLPLWHAVGVVRRPAAGGGIIPTEPPRLSVLRRARRDGRELIVVGLDGKSDELWVDPGRESAIVRAEWSQIASNGVRHLDASLDVRFREVDGHWQPAGWRYESEAGLPNFMSQDFEVIRFDPAADISRERFHVDRTAGELLAGLRENLERLNSGAFTVSGTRETSDADRRRGSTITFRAYCAFDRSCARYHWKEWFTDRYGPAERPETRSGAIKYVRTPELSIHVPEEDSIAIDILPPGARMMGGDAMPFDPRVLGLVSDVELRNGMSRNGFARSFESVFDSYTNKYEVEEAVHETGPVYRVTFRLGPNHVMRKSVWIDAALGFTPVRMELGRLGADGKFPQDAVAVAAVKWAQRGSVWVPVRAEMESHFSYGRIELNLAWDQTNGRVGDEVFTVAGLDHPDLVKWKGGAPGERVQPEIVDYRTDPPTVIREQIFFEPERPNDSK